MPLINICPIIYSLGKSLLLPGGGYNCCTMGKLPKKEVVYPKREIGIDRPQKSYMNKRLQKSDIDYKLY